MIKVKKDSVKIKAKDFGQMMTEYIFVTKSVKNALVKNCEMTEEEAWEEIDRAIKFSKSDSPVEIVKMLLEEACGEIFGEEEEESEEA